MPLNEYKKFLAFLSVACITLTGGGCNSIRSTMLTRDEGNNYWTKVECLDGVPITLKVPTHIRISVIDQHFLTKVSAGGVSKWERVELDVPVRSVAVNYIYTEKIFTVDFARPAAGTMDLTLEMDEKEQYFKKIQDKVTDETIDDVANLISKVAPSGLFIPASSGDDASLKEVSSTVAVEIFEIDDPTLELKLSEFLMCHVNKSHDAWVAPPGVDNIRRVDLNNSHAHPSDELCPNCGPIPLGATSSMQGDSYLVDQAP